jgi:hypothetical protein
MNTQHAEPRYAVESALPIWPLEKMWIDSDLSAATLFLWCAFNSAKARIGGQNRKIRSDSTH